MTMRRSWAWLLCAGFLASTPATWAAEPLRILFVGNSFTYTRPPALQYNVAAVDDMNYANFLANPAGMWILPREAAEKSTTRCAAARRGAATT